MSFTTVLLISTDPPFPRIFSITPCQKSSPASVTTNDGRPTRVTSEPCSAPIAAQTKRATRIAAHHGQSSPEGLSSSASTTPLSPATYPIDRSISPSRSAYTSPIARTLKTAAWTGRLTRFPAVRE